MSKLAYQARSATGLGQRAFARLINVHPATVTRWETGERTPSGTACTLLRLIQDQPYMSVLFLREINPAGRTESPRAK